MELSSLLRKYGIKTSNPCTDYETGEVGYSQYPEDYPKGSKGDKAIRYLLNEKRIRIDVTDKGFVIMATDRT